MLASIVASKTARLITACVCPVVGAGTLTMAVPKVRNAVHKVTAPREYALPKTRERSTEPVAFAGPTPCTIGEGTPFSTGYVGQAPNILSSGPIAFANALPDSRLPFAGADIIRADSIERSPIGGVPEPHTWLQLLIGFTLIGGAARMARKRPTEDEEALLVRVEALKTDARR
jgi:hypothetical protein